MAMSVCRSVGRLVGWSVGWCHLAFLQHIVHVAALFGLVQSGLDQCRPIQSTLVKSSQIQTNLVKSSQIQKNLFQAISGSIQRMWWLFIVQSRLAQTSVYQFSLLQSTLVKSSNHFAFMCDLAFQQHIVNVVALYSLVQSSLPPLDQ